MVVYPWKALPAQALPHAQATPKLVYPLFEPATAPFTTDGRWFGAPRPGRLHAAVDLARPLQSAHPCHRRWRRAPEALILFDLGTDALEVHHPGIGVVRYGEISPLALVDLKAGDVVKMGNVIAHVGQQSTTGFCMLHFEMYTGKATGALTEPLNEPYERRSDSENPSTFVSKLHKLTFGD